MTGIPMLFFAVGCMCIGAGWGFAIDVNYRLLGAPVTIIGIVCLLASWYGAVIRDRGR